MNQKRHNNQLSPRKMAAFLDQVFLLSPDPFIPPPRVADVGGGAISLPPESLMNAQAAGVIPTDTKSLSRFSVIKFSLVKARRQSSDSFLSEVHSGFYPNSCSAHLHCMELR